MRKPPPALHLIQGDDAAALVNGEHHRRLGLPAQMLHFVRLTLNKPWQVRFIELMPMGVCAAWPRERFLSAQAVLARLPQLSVRPEL